MVYMTTDEWHKIERLIAHNDLYQLRVEITTNAYNLDISEKELDGIINDYKVNKQFDEQNSYFS